MLISAKKYRFFFLLAVCLLISGINAFAQKAVADKPVQPTQPTPQYGKYDTIFSAVVVYEGDTIPAKTLESVSINHPMTYAMRKRLEEWTRLRNAVYVTYPYARRAGAIMNDMNLRLENMPSEKDRKTYIKSRESELKKEFTNPLENMSVYQGKVLMKLINRQTGNNCYDIIKEYRGGFTARFWQTVAFFFGSNLKQPYDAKGDDKQIESIVLEVQRMYGG